MLKILVDGGLRVLEVTSVQNCQLLYILPYLFVLTVLVLIHDNRKATCNGENRKIRTHIMNIENLDGGVPVPLRVLRYWRTGISYTVY